MALEITSTRDEDGIRVIVGGEVDLATARRFEEALQRAEQAARSVVLDLSEVEFFDSTGLQILLDADVRARQNGHRLVVVAGDGEAARVLELTQVSEQLTVAVVE